VTEFVAEMKALFPEHFEGCRVLEAGSLDINGSVRPFFHGCDYIGIDWREGKGVDVVSFAHEYNPGLRFKTVISTEMLEHDIYADQTVPHLHAVLDAGGLLIVTCAGPGRGGHEPESGVNNHYENITPERVLDWYRACQPHKFFIRQLQKDLHFWMKR